jgi:hypothetical protein
MTNRASTSASVTKTRSSKTKALQTGVRSSAKKGVAKQTAAVYRVNARLDDVQAGKLAYLAETTGLSTSDVMREAVDRFYMQVKQEKGSKRPILESLIGKARDGLPADLSTNYKQYLTESLMKKHGYR